MEDAAAVTLEPERARIAGFWRRLGAFVVDCAILAAGGWVLGSLFFDQLAAMGGGALVLGFAISVAYFAWFDGPRGPSPGKRMLGVRVVDASGRTLSIGRAAARCAVFNLPYFLNGAPLPAALQGQVAATLVQAFVVFGLGGAMVYLFLFNRTTGQSLHDLATGTFVVDDDGAQGPPEPSRMPRLHWAVAGAWLALVVGGHLTLWAKMAPAAEREGVLATLTAVQRAVQAVPEVRRAKVIQATAETAAGDPRWYSVTVLLRSWPDDRAAVAREIVETALAAGWRCRGEQRFVVSMQRGFAMGIAHAWHGETSNYTCAEWVEKKGVVLPAE